MCDMLSQGSEIDPRVRRTRELIRGALVELIEDKGFGKITIGDIAERAKVNRVTFYKHYKNKYDLVERVFEEAFEELAEEMNFTFGKFTSKAKLSDFFEDTPQPMINLFNYFSDNARLFRAMLGSDGSSWFESKLRDSIQAVMSKRWQDLAQNSEKKKIGPMKADIRPEIILGLSANFLIGSITWWLKSGIHYKAEEMAILVYRFMLTGLNSPTNLTTAFPSAARHQESS